MALSGCGPSSCGCAIESATLDVARFGDTFVVEQTEFTVLTQIEAALANAQASIDQFPTLYVAKVGDNMTGPLYLFTPSAGIVMTRADENPYIQFSKQDGSGIGYVGGFTTDAQSLRLWANTGTFLRFATNNVEVARINTSGIFEVGKTSSGVANTGCEVQPAGSIWATRSVLGTNIYSNKTGAADVNAGIHQAFASAGTVIGTITRATASTVAYNTTSDEDLKTNIVEIDDQLALYWMRTVQPMLFEYIVTPGVVHGGYIAQRVAAAWPESISLGIVTPGHGDIDARTWDHDGNETTPAGKWAPWQIDLSKFVPFIHAGLQAVDVRVSTHDERIDRLELAVESAGLALESAALAIAELQKN